MKKMFAGLLGLITLCEGTVVVIYRVINGKSSPRVGGGASSEITTSVSS